MLQPQRPSAILPTRHGRLQKGLPKPAPEAEGRARSASTTSGPCRPSAVLRSLRVGSWAESGEVEETGVREAPPSSWTGHFHAHFRNCDLASTPRSPPLGREEAGGLRQVTGLSNLDYKLRPCRRKQPPTDRSRLTKKPVNWPLSHHLLLISTCILNGTLFSYVERNLRNVFCLKCAEC